MGTQGTSAFIRNGTGSYVNFNLSTGVPTNSGWDSGSAYMIDVGNGWYRCYASVTGSGASGFLFGVANGNGLSSNAGDNIIAGGFQLERGTFPTSYIPTTTTALTRNADEASITGTDFSSFYNQSEGTWLASYKRGVSSGFAGKTGVVTGISPDEYSYAPIVDEPLARGFSNRTYTEIFDNPTVAIGSNVLQTGTYDSIIGQATLCVNGRSVVSSVANGASYATIISITIGGGGNANYRSLNSHISNLTYWPKRLTDTSLQYLTT